MNNPLNPLSAPSTALDISTKDEILNFSPTSNPELIELLIEDRVGTQGEDFFKKFQSILQKTPKIGSTSKTEFFSYDKIGTFTVLPNTTLMNKLNIKRIFLKPLLSGKRILTVKVGIQLETKTTKSLKLYTFCSTEAIKSPQHWKLEELKDLFTQLENTSESFKEYKTNNEWQIFGDIYHIDRDFVLHRADLQIRVANQLKDLITTIDSLDNDFWNLSKKAEFIEIVQLTGEKLNPKNQALEKFPILDLPTYFQKLSSQPKIDESNSQDVIKDKTNKVIQGIAQASSDLMRDLATVYRYWQPKLKLDTAEFAYQGFTLGVLENLFKYRFALDIAVEKILGKGRADITFLSRLDGQSNKCWNAIPIALEFKAGKSETPEHGLKQISDRGYLYATPRMRTTAATGIGVGVNFDVHFQVPAISEIKTINVEPINFIETLSKRAHIEIQLTKQSNLPLATKKEHTNLSIETLKNSLAYLDYSIVRQNGASDNSNYFKNLILGQVIGTTNPGSSIYVVPSPLSLEKGKENLSLFFVKEEVTLILNLNNVSNHLRDFPPHGNTDIDIVKQKIAFLKSKGILHDADSYCMVSIDVKNSQSTPNLHSLNTGSLKDLALDTRTEAVILERHSFQYKKIRPVSFLKDNKLAYNEVAQELLQFYEKGLNLIHSESDLQALWQGGLMVQESLQVFTESNHALGKRADLVLSAKKEGHPQQLTIVELKYAKNQQQASEQQTIAKIQVRNYIKNTKSFSDGKTLDLIALTYNAQSHQQGGDVFLYHEETEKITHTSASELELNSPDYVDSDPLAIPFQLPSSSKISSIENFRPSTSTKEKSFELESGLKSPLSDYTADVESNAGSSPEKKKLDSSITTELLGGITTALGGLIGAYGATHVTVAGVSGALNTVRSSLTALGDIQDSEIRQFVQKTEQFLENEAKNRQREREARTLKKDAEKLAKKSKRVQKRLKEREREAEYVRDRNKQKKQKTAHPTRAKRDVSLLIETFSSKNFSITGEPLEKTLKTFADNGSKLFLLYGFNYYPNKVTEVIKLECSRTVDYQDHEILFLDLSFWPRSAITIRDYPIQNRHCIQVTTFHNHSFKIYFTKTSDIHFEIITSEAIIYKFYTPYRPVLEASSGETKKTSSEASEPSTPLSIQNRISTQSATDSNNTTPLSKDLVAQNGITTTTHPSLTQSSFFRVRNCPTVVLSNTYTKNFEEGDCTINPKINSSVVVEPSHSPQFINLSTWNILQNLVHYKKNENQLILSLKNQSADRGFQVILSGFLEIKSYTTLYTLSDENFEKIGLIFSDNQLLLKQSQINRFQLELRIETFFNDIPEPKLSPLLIPWLEERTSQQANAPIIFTVGIDSKGTHRVYGSNSNDKILVDNSSESIYGGDGHDCYILRNNLSPTKVYIFNKSHDEKLDYLILPVPFDTIKFFRSDDADSMELRSTYKDFNRIIVLVKYCANKTYRHLEIITSDSISFTLECSSSLYANNKQIGINQKTSDFVKRNEFCSKNLENNQLIKTTNTTAPRSKRDLVKIKKAFQEVGFFKSKKVVQPKLLGETKPMKPIETAKNPTRNTLSRPNTDISYISSSAQQTDRPLLSKGIAHANASTTQSINTTITNTPSLQGFIMLLRWGIGMRMRSKNGTKKQASTPNSAQKHLRNATEEYASTLHLAQEHLRNGTEKYGPK